MQPKAITFARLACFHDQTGNDCDKNLGENPEFPHCAIVQLKAQEVKTYVETDELDADGFEHVLGSGTRFEIDGFLIGASALEAEDLHADPDSFTDREQQEQREMVILEPCVQEYPNTHEIRCAIERVQPKRIRTDFLFLGQPFESVASIYILRRSASSNRRVERERRSPLSVRQASRNA